MRKPTASPLFGAVLLVIVHLVWVGTTEISKYLLTDLRFKRPIFMVFVRSVMWTCCLILYFLRSTGEKRKSVQEVFFYFVYFAPPWMLSSTIGQVSIVFTSVSAVFLIAASAPLFVLILATFTSRNVADHCSVTKLVLVLVNLGSVAVVSEFSPSVLGSILALVSTICGAVYLTHVSAYQAKHGSVDMNLTIGTVGVLTLIVTVPLMVIGHITGLEPQLPVPTWYELGLVLFMCFVGSILMDYLWLYATVLTGSFISSLSVTLSIPLSMAADTFLRGEPPHVATIIASVPIMLSFVGATLLTTREKVHIVEEEKKPEVPSTKTSISTISSAFDVKTLEAGISPKSLSDDHKDYIDIRL